MDEDTEIVIDGWKGKSEIQIYGDIMGKGDVVVREFRKCKESGEIEESTHKIKKEDITSLYMMLKKNCDVGEKYGYRFVVNKLIEMRGWDVDIEAFNGGKNRSEFYFPFYYYPMKVLEKTGLVQYWGRGGVTLLE